MKPKLISIALTLISATMAVAADFATPEKALRTLEDAYARKDIEAAMAAKDFEFEARSRIAALQTPSWRDRFQRDGEIPSIR